MDFSKFSLNHILDMLDSGETKWDIVEPFVGSLAPMLDGMFHLNPTQPAVVAATGTLPTKPGEPFTITHVLAQIKAGEVEWDVLEPLLREFATLIDKAMAILHPAHPAVVAVVAALPVTH